MSVKFGQQAYGFIYFFLQPLLQIQIKKKINNAFLDTFIFVKFIGFR